MSKSKIYLCPQAYEIYSPIFRVFFLFKLLIHLKCILQQVSVLIRVISCKFPNDFPLSWEWRIRDSEQVMEWMGGEKLGQCTWVYHAPARAAHWPGEHIPAAIAWARHCCLLLCTPGRLLHCCWQSSCTTNPHTSCPNGPCSPAASLLHSQASEVNS